MQHTTGVAVLATHLADTDRRALSQAWYSALHLADRALPARPAPRTPAPPSEAHAPVNAHRAAAQRPSADARGLRTAPHAARATRFDLIAAAERRTPKTELARRIERGLARRIPRAAAASFAVRASDGRVALIVRTDGARTRVVAVCAPPLRERVERALAQARFALAGRGIRAEVA